MKKKFYLWAAIAAVAIAFNACQNDETPAVPQEVSLNFNIDNTTDASVATKSTATRTVSSMPTAAQIGVFFAPAGTGDLNSVTGNSANRKYLGNGIRQDGNPVYWNDYTTALDIYAYSPYKATVPLTTNGNTLSWTVSADQSTGNLADNDLLISNGVRALTYTDNIGGGKSTFNFRHTLSKLTINIVDNSKEADGNVYTAEQLQTATVVLNSLYTSCDVSFVNTPEAGATSLGNLGSKKTTIAPKKSTPTTGYAATHEAICVPQTLSTATPLATITVTDAAGVVQNYNVNTRPADNQLLQGTNHVINVTLTKTGIQLDFEVADWTTKPTDYSIHIDHLATGTPGNNDNGDITPATGDILSLAYLTGGIDGTLTGNPRQQGTFTYTATGSNPATYSWGATSPFYWDDFAYAADPANSYSFAALYTPVAKPANGGIEKDYLAGKTTAAYGAPLRFVQEGGTDYCLQHIMSQLTLVLKAGEGYTLQDMQSATVRLLAGYEVMTDTPTLLGAFTQKKNTDDAISADDTRKDADWILVRNESKDDADNRTVTLHTLTLCPQTWTAGTNIISVTLGDNTYYIKAKKDAGNNNSSDDNADFTLSAGKNRTLTATLAKTGISVSIDVKEWVPTNATGNGDFNDPNAPKN